jgi:CHAD domain-containing protein
MSSAPHDVPPPAAPAAESTGARIRESLDRQRETFVGAASRVRERHDDEAIHDLRVASRRLTASLSLWRDFLRNGARRRATRGLRRLRRAIGPVRELEVHVADLREISMRPSAPSRVTLAQSPLQRLALADLGARTARAMDRGRRRAARRAGGPRVRRILTALERAVEAIERRETQLMDRLAGARARVTAAESGGRLAIERALVVNDDTALHGARIAVKKWRYALEAFGIAAPVDAERIARLRGIQTCLGLVHDRATLRDRISRHAGILASRGFERAAETMRSTIAEVEAQRLAAVEAFREEMRSPGLESPPAPDAPAGGPAEPDSHAG